MTVAAEHFPLGAGFARFGSYEAGVHYSPEYVKLGYTRVYGLEPTPQGERFSRTPLGRRWSAREVSSAFYSSFLAFGP